MYEALFTFLQNIYPRYNSTMRYVYGEIYMIKLPTD